ncbi:unnamed protein product [Ilex paraguariensis]|uniref:Secreted protein n=1 Tax=Ilex paraguariensis TaxID=185542 RepID=A0ABC8TUW8_9AQUA
MSSLELCLPITCFGVLAYSLHVYAWPNGRRCQSLTSWKGCQSLQNGRLIEKRDIEVSRPGEKGRGGADRRDRREGDSTGRGTPSEEKERGKTRWEIQ